MLCYIIIIKQSLQEIKMLNSKKVENTTASKIRMELRSK